jgi:predicted nucleic acid-binding protein
LIRDAPDASDTGFVLAPLDRRVADAVAGVTRGVVPDMPDRIVAATALALGLPLVTRDTQTRSSPVPTIG